MNNQIRERLQELRILMKKKGIDYYLVPTGDFHLSEYVGAHFKCRQYITGFTGSSGTAVISEHWAGLWTDGRYFLQAASQLEGTTVKLFRMGQPGVPTIREFLASEMFEGQCLGFDGRVISEKECEALEKKLFNKKIRISCEEDLVGQIWKNRPALSSAPVSELDIRWSGKLRKDKLKEIREKMNEKGADIFLLTDLDDIAWLLNIRGGDTDCNPVVLSYLLVTKERVYLFVNETAVPDLLRNLLERDGVELAPYDSFYSVVRSIQKNARILLNKARVNSLLVRSLPDTVIVIDDKNPTELLKAVKNPVEVENERIAHIKDGVAVTRFMYWLKKNVGRIPITEISAANYLHGLRELQEHFMGESFDTIAAYGAHAAIVHYSAVPETDFPVEPKGFLLVDSGGQYLEGTTDITRTMVMGPVTEEEKKFFTAVLRGHLNLGAARFLYGCRGVNLDYIARAPLWELGVDYNHGTGHGVGYYQNVHEGPNSFRWKLTEGITDSAVFEEGMITSNEPGYYEDGKFGIRHENLILCVKAEKGRYGQFMHFENLTMVPFDLDGVLPELLNEREKELLNQYHKKVYDTISPYLEDEERDWLKEATREV